MIKVGEFAPEIDALTTKGERFVLSDARQPWTVVYFFPKAFTPGCTEEAKAFAAYHVELSLLGAAVVGISSDKHETQCRFAESVKAPFPMIGDEDGSIGRAYGVLWPIVGIPHRVTFIVDRARKVVAVFRHELAATKHRDDVLRTLDELSRRGR